EPAGEAPAVEVVPDVPSPDELEDFGDGSEGRRPHLSIRALGRAMPSRWSMGWPGSVDRLRSRATESPTATLSKNSQNGSRFWTPMPRRLRAVDMRPTGSFRAKRNRSSLMRMGRGLDEVLGRM